MAECHWYLPSWKEEQCYWVEQASVSYSSVQVVFELPHRSHPLMKRLDSVVAFYVIVPQHQSYHLECGPPRQAEDYTGEERKFVSQKQQGNQISITFFTHKYPQIQTSTL